MDQKQNKQKKNEISKLEKGRYFGEISVLYETVTSATVKSTNYTDVGFLDKKAIQELFHHFPLYKEQLEHTLIKNYHEDLRLFIIQSLKRIEYLEDDKVALNEMLIKLSYCFEQQEFEKDSMLF